MDHWKMDEESVYDIDCPIDMVKFGSAAIFSVYDFGANVIRSPGNIC